MSKTTQSWARGLSVSVTGFEKTERKAIQALIVAGGAQYVTYLNRNCTHLIVSDVCKDVPSKKLRVALQNDTKWKTLLVTLDWLLQSSTMGFRLSESRFLFSTATQAEVRLVCGPSLLNYIKLVMMHGARASLNSRLCLEGCKDCHLT